MDITSKLRNDQGEHKLTLDTLVLKNHTGKYEPFTNWRGWLFGDPSFLDVHIALFVYRKATVEALKSSRRTPCSRAEAALISGEVKGASWPKDEPTKEKPVKITEARTMEVSANGQVRASDEPVLRQSSPIRQRLIHHTLALEGDVKLAEDPCYADFESRSPWYVFNESQPQKIEKAALQTPALVVPVMQWKLVQGDSRFQQVHVDRSKLPTSWGQVALRIRLEKPGGTLQFDHWDRVGSVGLMLNSDPAVRRLNPDAQAGAFCSTLHLFALIAACALNTFV